MNKHFPLGSGPTIVFVLRLWLSLGVVFWVETTTARADVIAVTPDTLEMMLNAARPGDTLELTAGRYAQLQMRRIEGSTGAPITLRSADPDAPAHIEHMRLRQVAHIRLEGLIFDYTFNSGDALSTRPFDIRESRNVTVTQSVFHGDLVADQGSTDDGFPNGYGLLVRDSQAITISYNRFAYFMRGMVIGHSDGVTLRGNEITLIRSDGVNFAQVRNVLVEENHFHDFLRPPESNDHPDMIQMWTRNTTAPSVGLVIRNNVLNAGEGKHTQSIFLRNDQVDRGLAGVEMFYRDITIEGNVIINAHLHGITVGETEGLWIRNNTVVRNRFAAGPNPDRLLWTPQIKVSEQARNVEIMRNVTRAVIGHEGQPDWRVADNVLVQDASRLEPGFYGLFFVPASTVAPQHVSSFMALPGGPLDGTNLGAPRLSGQ